MPQPLENRIQAAMGRAARAQTVGDLLPEIDAAIAEAEAERARLDKLSTSIAASEAEADAAADGAVRAARRITRLKAQRDQVQARHTELMNTDRRKRMLDEHAQIRDRRDALANDLRVQWPKLVDQIVNLLHRIKASDAEIEAFQVRGVPAGCEWLASAEAVARDCPANFRDSGTAPIPRFTEIRLPSLDGRGLEALAWPDTRADVARRIAAAEAEQARLRAQTAAREAEAAQWQRYMVTPPPGARPPRVVCRQGAVDVTRAGVLELNEAQAKAARALKCELQPLRPGQVLGAVPSGAHF